MDYRTHEVKTALDFFKEEMGQIATRKLELVRMELDAWRQLEIVLLADDPKRLSPYFRDQMREAISDLDQR